MEITAHQLAISVSPNPFVDHIVFELDKVGHFEDYEVQLLYPDGRLIKTYPLSVNQLRIDTQNLALGVYLYVLKNKHSRQLGKIGRIVRTN